MVITVLVKTMIKSILKYLKYSNVIFYLSLNPIWWRFKYAYHHNPDGLDPNMRLLVITLLMLKIEIVIDDGTW